MALKIQDDYGIVTERKRQREIYGHIIERRVQAAVSSPGKAVAVEREINRRVKEEVEVIMQRRVQERVAEIERICRPTGPAVGEILVLVSDVTGVSVPNLVGPRRARNCTWPRHLAMYLIWRARTDLSLPAIGHAIGGRDHTTVMNALRKFEERRTNDLFARWLDDPRVQAFLANCPEADLPRDVVPFRRAA